MNISWLGRRRSKLILLSIFILGNILTICVYQNIKLVFVIYNINKMFLFLSGTIFCTHLNESFTTKDRLEVFSYAFFLGKLTAAFAPFVTEYLSDIGYYFVVLVSSSLLMISYWFQKETLGSIMLDD